MIGLVWAEAANGVIGRDGAMPWHLPEDLAHFRELTRGATVVMGRRTWDSLPPRFRPLPGRRNVVLTRDRSWVADGAEPVHELSAALVVGPGTSVEVGADVWVIGGAEIYRAALPYAGLAVVTQLRETVPGDAYAPRLEPQWQLTDADPALGWHESRAGFHYRFRRFRRS